MASLTTLHVAEWRQSEIEGLASLLKMYVERYISTDVGTLVLLNEGFGPDVVKPYISDTWIRGFLHASVQNPVFLLYIPLLMTIEPRIEQQAENIYDKSKVTENPKVKNVIERHVLVERKETLVSLALASKYVLYIDLEKHKGYIEFFTDMLNIITEAVNKYLRDLDPVEKVSLLYIYEVHNALLNKLGKTPLNISWLRIDEITKAKLPLSIKAGIASLLYDIYKIKKDKDYLNKFYDTLSDVDLEALYIMLREAESRSTEILKEYYQSLDEESISALSLPLNEVEFALVSKLVNIIQGEFVMVPVIGFSDFVSKYYSIPKKLLKIWLWIALFTYILLTYLLSFIVALVLSIIFGFMLWYLLKNIIIVGIGGVIMLMIIQKVLEKVQSLAENKVFEWLKSKEESAKGKAQELKNRIKHFDHFVP